MVVFRQLRDLMANVFGKGVAIDKRETSLETTKGSPQSPEISRTSVHKHLKTGSSYLPLCVNVACYFFASLRKERSLGSTQPNLATFWEVNHICKGTSNI